MGLIQQLNYDTPGNFTYDTDLIEIVGGKAQLKLLEALAAFNEDFANDTDFIYNAAEAEFSGGQIQQLDQTPANSQMGSQLTTKDLNWHKSGGSLTGTLNGSPTFSGGKMVCAGAQGVYWSRSTAAIETIKFKYTPNYSTTPPANVNLCSTYNGTNNNDRIGLTNSPSGNTIRLTAYSSSGAVVVAAATTVGGAWTPTASQEYEFELVIDSAAGTLRVFIDGVLHGTLSPGAWSRGGVSSRYYLGAHPVVYNRAEGSFDDYIMFTNAQHTSGYTPGYSVPEFLYTETSADLPEFQHTGLGQVTQYDGLTVTGAGSPRYTIQLNQSGDYLYWDGAAWSVSDGSYAQANDEATFDANANALTVGAGIYSQIRVHFPDSNTQSSVDDLDLDHTANTVYSTANPSIINNSGVFADGLIALQDEVATRPGSDNIRYIINADNDDYYWDGADWVVSDGSYAQANELSEVAANADALDLSGGETVKVRALLHSDDGSTTPDLTSVSVNYNFFAVTPIPRKVILYGWLRESNDDPLVGTVSIQTLAPFEHTGVLIPRSEVTVATDADGYWEVEVYETETVGKTYKAVINYTEPFGRSVSYTIEVPDQDSVNFTDLITA